jgi:hypothetical protein
VYDDMTTEDTFTSDELAVMDLGDELRMDEADAARYAAEGDPWLGGEMQEAELGAERNAEVPSCCYTRGHHAHCPGY